MPLSAVELADQYGDLPAAGSKGRRIYVNNPSGRAGMYNDTGAAWTRAAAADQDAIFNEVAGFKAQNFNILASSTLALTSQAVRYTLIPLRQGDVVTYLHFWAAVIPATVTTLKAGLSTTAGARLGASANAAATWAGTGIGTFTLAAAYTATATGWYYATLLSDATTAGTMRAGTTATGFDGVAGAIGVALAGVETGQTDLDATATITAATQPLWVAWS